jgi:phosphocarrier protein
MPKNHRTNAIMKMTSGGAMVSDDSRCKVKGTFVVSNDRGLHTRPSTEIVKCATSFKSEIWLAYQKNRVNAKSILGVLMLAAAKGAKVVVEAVGEDADLAVATIIDLAQHNFHISY